MCNMVSEGKESSFLLTLIIKALLKLYFCYILLLFKKRPKMWPPDEDIFHERNLITVLELCPAYSS